MCLSMVGRIFRAICLYGSLMALSYSNLTFAEEPTIFDMRKPVTLSDSDPVYRDFYINGGIESGLQPGMLVNVQRKVTLYDNYQNRSPGELIVAVGKVKIIHAQKGISVARHYSDFDRKDRPTLEDEYIMIGDRLDVKSAEMDKSKSGRSTASQEPAQAPAPKKNEGPEVSLEIKPPDLPQPSQASSSPDQPTAEPVSLPTTQ